MVKFATLTLTLLSALAGCSYAKVTTCQQAPDQCKPTLPPRCNGAAATANTQTFAEVAQIPTSKCLDTTAVAAELADTSAEAEACFQQTLNVNGRGGQKPVTLTGNEVSANFAYYPPGGSCYTIGPLAAQTASDDQTCAQSYCGNCKVVEVGANDDVSNYCYDHPSPP